MNVEWIRTHCLSFKATTESIQWGDNLVFKVAGKIFAIAALEPDKHFLSFKCSPDDFQQLTEQPGINPSPYLARAQWVSIENEDVLPRRELKELLQKTYDLVVAKLPKNQRAALEL